MVRRVAKLRLGERAVCTGMEAELGPEGEVKGYSVSLAFCRVIM